MLSTNRAANLAVISLRCHVDLNLCKAIFAVAEVIARREDNVGWISHAETAVGCIFVPIVSCRHPPHLGAYLAKDVRLDFLCLLALLSVFMLYPVAHTEEEAGENSILDSLPTV
jgi:hypothetical protein